MKLTNLSKKERAEFLKRLQNRRQCKKKYQPYNGMDADEYVDSVMKGIEIIEDRRSGMSISDDSWL